MEEIDIKDLLMYFVKKIPMLLAVTIAIMVLGMLYSLILKKPLYHGDATLILVQENSGYSQSGNAINQSDLALNQKLVATYTELIKSRRILNNVIEELKLDYSYEELKAKIGVSSISDTEIIKISVSDRDNALAADIANTIAEVFKEEVAEIYNLQNVSTIDEAEVQENPYNMNAIRDVVIFFAVGVVVAVAVVFIIYYFDTSIKSPEEVEKRLGVPVIGTIPLSRKEKRKK